MSDFLKNLESKLNKKQKQIENFYYESPPEPLCPLFLTKSDLGKGTSPQLPAENFLADAKNPISTNLAPNCAAKNLAPKSFDEKREDSIDQPAATPQPTRNRTATGPQLDMDDPDRTATVELMATKLRDLVHIN
jgi:hypothetical protein